MDNSKNIKQTSKETDGKEPSKKEKNNLVSEKKQTQNEKEKLLKTSYNIINNKEIIEKENQRTKIDKSKIINDYLESKNKYKNIINSSRRGGNPILQNEDTFNVNNN